MPANLTLVPLSARKTLARKARQVVRYTQATMGLEGQAGSPAAIRQLARDAYARMLARRSAA